MAFEFTKSTAAPSLFRQDKLLGSGAAMAQFTVVTATMPSRLSKAFRFNKNGDVERLPGGTFARGSFRVMTIENLSGFAEVLAGLTSSNALVYGVPLNAAAKKLLTRNTFERAGRPEDAVTRTKDAFRYPEGAGVMMLDYDPPKDCKLPLDLDGLVAAVRAAVPGLAQYEMLWYPSASSCISNGDEELWGVRGQRLYLMVQQAADMPRAGKVLQDRLWLSGYGYLEVSKSGALLERTLVDGSVWQVNRMDFAGGSHCTPPLRQDRGLPVLIAGEAAVVDSAIVFDDLTADENDTVQALKKYARDELSMEAKAAREAWVETRIRETLSKAQRDNPDAVEQAQFRLRQVLETAELSGDFMVHVECDGGLEAVSVATLLADPARYDQKLTLDPVEPDYDGGRIVGKLFLLQGKPNLHSFAHGGKTYRLNRETGRIQVVGGHTAEAVAQTADFLRHDPLAFDYGEALAIIDHGRLHILDEHTLSNHLGHVLQFWKMVSKAGHDIEVDIDPPTTLLRQILGLKDRRKLKPLDSVLTGPVVFHDGSVSDQPGYHALSRSFFDPVGQDVQSVPPNPSMDDAREALTTLMTPFTDFPFVDSFAKGAMLAALLTAVERPVLPTSPAFAFDAPVQGSGKTLLARCVGYLATGREPDTFPHTKGRDDEEVRKRLFSALMMGTKTIIWDNVIGAFDSAATAGFLTSPMMADRVLGKSQALRVPNRALLIFTGNNIAFEGDMPRRVIKCRIDPRSATPFAREFAMDPFDHVQTHRLDLVTAACTLIRAYQSSGAPRAKGRMASFEEWDDIVRQTVAWVGTTLAPGEYGDPMEIVREAQAADPTVEALGDLLQLLSEKFGSKWFTGKDVELAGAAGYFSPLKEALSDVAGEDISGNARRIGKLLSARKGQIAHGMFLTSRKPNEKDAVCYRVEHEGEWQEWRE